MKKYCLPLKEWFKKEFGFFRTKQTFEQIQNHIKGSKIIDIGSGEGYLSKILKDKGFNIYPIDVKDRNKIDSINFQVYDGQKIPFEDKSFDIALLMTVLHHTQNPDEIIKEAFRVSDRVIIIEDIYESKFEKYKTFILFLC